MNLSQRWICDLYHGLCTFTRAFHIRYLHRAGQRAMGQRRCVKGYDRSSKWYNEKQQGTVLGSEATSAVLSAQAARSFEVWDGTMSPSVSGTLPHSPFPPVSRYPDDRMDARGHIRCDLSPNTHLYQQTIGLEQLVELTRVEYFLV